MKKDDDWKKMLNNWQNSRKHHQLMQQIKRKRMYNLTKTELLNIIEGVYNFSELEDEDKEAFDWLETDLYSASKNDIIASFIQTSLQWHFYIKKYELLEEYELCAKIRDVIKVELADCKRMLDRYFILTEEDEENLDFIIKQTREQIEQNYNNSNK